MVDDTDEPPKKDTNNFRVQFRNQETTDTTLGTYIGQEGGVPRAVELVIETAQEAKPTLLGNLRSVTKDSKIDADDAHAQAAQV